MVVLENLVDLLQPNGAASGEPACDADVIILEFNAIGYSARAFRVQASEYGSQASRERLYFVAYLGT